MTLIEILKTWISGKQCSNCKYWEYLYDCFGKCPYHDSLIPEDFSLCNHYIKKEN